MTRFNELPGLEIHFRPELQTQAELAITNYPIASLKLSVFDVPHYIGDGAIEQEYIPSWQVTAAQLYRPGQKMITPALLQPIADSPVFGGAGQLRLANDVPAFMDDLDIASMVLLGNLESDGITREQTLSLIVATEPSYHGVLAMPATHLRDQLQQIKTRSHLRWQIILKSGSHTAIEVPFDMSNYDGVLVPGFGHLLNDHPENLFTYSWN